MNPRTSNVIALVVTFVWATSFLADIAMKNYKVDPLIHTVMMVVAGAAFGGQLLKKGEK